MQIDLGSRVIDAASETIVIAVVSAGDGNGSRVDELTAAVKEAAAHGADVVELTSADARLVEPGLSEAAGLGWIVATGNADDARWAAEQGAVAVHWTGGVDDHHPDDFGAMPVMSADLRVARGEGWFVTSLVAGEVSIDEGNGDERAGPLIVDLDGETDRARVAALTTLAMARGAWAVRTVTPQAARRAAYVVHAVEEAE